MYYTRNRDTLWHRGQDWHDINGLNWMCWDHTRCHTLPVGVDDYRCSCADGLTSDFMVSSCYCFKRQLNLTVVCKLLIFSSCGDAPADITSFRVMLLEVCLFVKRKLNLLGARILCNSLNSVMTTYVRSSLLYGRLQWLCLVDGWDFTRCRSSV